MSKLRDLASFIDCAEAFAPAVVTADQNGTAVDRQALDGQGLSFFVQLAASGDTIDGSNYIELQLEDSSDNSTWADCADSDITNAVTGSVTGTFAKIDAASEDSAIYSTTYRGDKRYVRLRIELTGTHSTGTGIGAFAATSARDQPVSMPMQ